ncbi:MAG: hypothetical protein EOM23_07020, partial [Candidatus Moranbacteria bacterium]|nr:hypothetical protein [Candidatus Moranbacteria bacterium]
MKINSEQAKIVKKAFQLCIEKGSAGQVQRTLNELGYRVPLYESRRGKKHGNTKFTKQFVIRLLSNPAYIGKLTWAKKTRKGLHEKIIDDKIFARVQKILEGNKRTKMNEKAPKQHVFILSGILRCGKCGNMMSSKSGKNGSGQPYHYYQCTRNNHVGKIGCNSKYVPATPLENFVIDRVKELATKESEIKAMADQGAKKANKKVLKLQQDKEKLENTLQLTSSKLRNLIQSIEDGVTPFSVIKERITELEEDKKKIKASLEALDFEIQDTEKKTLDIEALKRNFTSLKDIVEKASPIKLKELFYRIIEVIELNESEDDQTQGHVRISYFEHPNLETPPPSGPQTTKSEQRNKALFAQSLNWLPTLDSRRNWAKPSKCKEIRILVKMYRRRGRGTAISLYDPLPPLPQAPRPVYKNIVAMAVQVREYLIENPQRTQTAAGNRFGITRARVSQLMTIVENLPDDFISIMKTTEDQSLLKRFSGKTMLR